MIHRLIPYLLIAGVISIGAGGTVMLSATSLGDTVKLLFNYPHLVDRLLNIGAIFIASSYVLSVIFAKNKRTTEKFGVQSYYNFLGFRKILVPNDKVTGVHILEFAACWLALLFWLISITEFIFSSS